MKAIALQLVTSRKTVGPGQPTGFVMADDFAMIVKSKVAAVKSGGALVDNTDPGQGETHWCKVSLDNGEVFNVAGDYIAVSGYLDLEFD